MLKDWSSINDVGKQAVQFRGRIEVIVPACVRGIGRISRGQLRNPSQDSVGTACAKSGMKREMGHQVARNVLPGHSQ